MRPLVAFELLNVWESGFNQTLIQKTLNLLSVACPELELDTLASLSIGERDARLLLLREWMFGTRLKNMASCPECSGPAEWECDIADIRVQHIQHDAPSKELRLEQDEFSIRFRLPNSLDMLSVIAEGSEQANPAKLLASCIIEAQADGKDCSVVDLPEKVIHALSLRMETEDPQADVRMVLNCPYCSHQWEVNFDIMSYFWMEIDSWAKRLVQDIHILAREYGWSEQDILDMSAVRRQIYLGMVN